MGWAPVIALLSFFAFRVLLESGKANRLRAAWTSLTRRASQYSTIDYPPQQTPKRLSFAPLAAPVLIILISYHKQFHYGLYRVSKL